VVTERTVSLGETHPLSFVDRFGIWLSTRKIARTVGSFAGRRIGDFGCGFDARTTRHFLDAAEHAVVIDLSLSDALKERADVTSIEGRLPDAMESVATGSIDVALCISVLEHLVDPDAMLAELRRVVAPGGVCIVNVPSWRGKRLLEFSAFRLGLSPAFEMDDHKMYYDPKDLWPLLVRAGFAPSAISVRRYKFGCNTLAVCRADALRPDTATPGG
jgi:SAM-dependent methyltransferase